MQGLLDLVRKIRWHTIAALVLVFIAGAIAGATLFPTEQNHAVYHKQGVLTNALLGFDVDTRGEFKELDPIENALREMIVERQKENQVQIVSIYFRLLNSGRWFSINEDEEYSPASLLKIPIMMAYYKKAEETPEILKETIYNDGRYARTEQSSIPEAEKLTQGVSYTIEDLIERMIRDSNNEAKYLLEANLESDFVSSIYRDANIEDPYTAVGDYMKVTDYPFFLRLLYNTTYLSQKFSEQGLTLLTESSFTQGLPALLPTDVKVAHKFGFRIMTDTTPNIGELHDCGIVYYPNHPYILCVMTKGYALEPLTKVIQDASLLTYQGVEEFFRHEQ